MVGREAGLNIPDYREWRRYPRRPLDHHCEMMLRHFRAQGFQELEEGMWKPGDILTVWTRARRRKANHTMIVTREGVLHASTGVRKVIHHPIDDRIIERVVCAFSYPGVKS
jgi:hypothetical protein